MRLPQELVNAIDQWIEIADFKKVKKAFEALSSRYRNQEKAGEQFIHEDEDEEILAYIALRMPATYAAIYFVLKRLLEEFNLSDIQVYRRLWGRNGSWILVR